MFRNYGTVYYILSSVSPAAVTDGAPDLGRGGELHAQIDADGVDDGPAVRGVVLGEPFECVQLAASETWHF
jgi:hypothetical protein